FISDQRRIFEILAVFLTGFGKFIFMDVLNWKLPFIAVVIFGWLVYILFRNYKVKGILHYWGFRADNLKSVALKVLPFGLISIAGFFLIGYWQGTINLTWHIIPILIIYPIWGTVQQFLMIGLVSGNFQDLRKFSMSKIVNIILTALLFSAVHYPNYWLMMGTFVLAMFYTFIYLKERNVYVLGLFHGWLGGLFFYTVVNRDPFLEVFGKLKF
ncbi:MAG: type II CAAX prenyl endopeptidase Rce1 family protein, partial [Cytophagaceae bacterium]